MAKWEKSAVKFSFKRCLTGLSILQAMAKELETETCESTKMCLAVDVLRVLGVLGIAAFSPFCSTKVGNSPMDFFRTSCREPKTLELKRRARITEKSADAE